MALEQELATYKNNLEEWTEYEGKYVLIKGTEVKGFYSSYDDALKAGYEKFELDPFLVKQVSMIEQVHTFTRFAFPCPTSPAR